MCPRATVLKKVKMMPRKRNEKILKFCWDCKTVFVSYWSRRYHMRQGHKVSWVSASNENVVKKMALHGLKHYAPPILVRL